ncbi:MAG: GvpL/GvpF family gas vesicle protein, partial [Solirubrobacterales bacterium]|nr:GvpL/GvpF family gas vesicle protein [Solirubrobacterales bacterium]
VRGCVELAVRVSLPPVDTPGSRDGAAYVRARLAREQNSRAAVDRTLEPLAEHALLTHRRIGSAESSNLTASYLVPAADVGRFADRVRDLAREHAELSLSCTGPWPPYSFVGEETG